MILTARGLFRSCCIDDDVYVVAEKHLRPEYIEAGNPPQYDVYDAMERYDVDTDEWMLSPRRRSTGPVSARPQWTAVSTPSAAWCEDLGSSPDPSFVTDLVEVYDLATDLWLVGPPLPEPWMGPTVERVGDQVIIAGGSYDRIVRDDAFVLEPGADT